MNPAPKFIAQARQARLTATEIEKPWHLLRAEAFPSMSAKLGFIITSTVTISWGSYSIIVDPALRHSNLLPCLIMSITGCITLALHAHRQKKALLSIIRQESPDLYRKILIETI